MYLKVSNLHLNFSDADLKNLFSSQGEVSSAEIAIDQFTDKSRGFGFVEMPNENEALKAIETLHRSKLNDQVILVEQSAPKTLRKGSYKVGTGVFQLYKFKKN